VPVAELISMNHTMDHDAPAGHSMMNIDCDGAVGKMKGGTWKGKMNKSNAMKYKMLI
jgi:hypothetical protein